MTIGRRLEAGDLGNLEEQVEEAGDEADEREEREDADDDDGDFVVVHIALQLVVLVNRDVD